MQYSHVSFSDESNWNSGRFRSIGLLSASRSDALSLHDEVGKLLSESQVKELKWNKIRTAKYRFAAQKAIDSCSNALSDGRVRIDVLIWDSQGRHSVRNPDSKANLQIMYYHLFRNVMLRKRPSDCVWRHVPDEHVGANWETLGSCLSARDSKSIDEQSCRTSASFSESFGSSIKRLFQIAEITEWHAQEMCLTQLAELFAGMGAFSREKFEEYRSWKRNQGYATTLFAATPGISSSPGLLEKYQVLSHFEAKIAQLDIPVALDQTGGLRTLDPSIPLNFWWYEPKSRFDEARPRYLDDSR